MYKEISEVEFIDEFFKHNLGHLFTADALRSMYKYLKSKEQVIMDFYIIDPKFLSEYFTEYNIKELELKENLTIEEVKQTNIVINVNKERILIYGYKK